MTDQIQIVPYPTASGMQRALSLDAGISLQVKYIGVGSGLQAIQLDDAGRAITDTLKQPVGYLEILTAKKVNPYQWQFTVDLAGLKNTEWRFSEFTLCDANKNAIAIYGSATTALYPVTPYLTNALLSVNLLVGTFPSDSIVIEHHNQPLELFAPSPEEIRSGIDSAITAALPSIVQQVVVAVGGQGSSASCRSVADILGRFGSIENGVLVINCPNDDGSGDGTNPPTNAPVSVNNSAELTLNIAGSMAFAGGVITLDDATDGSETYQIENAILTINYLGGGDSGGGEVQPINASASVNGSAELTLNIAGEVLFDSGAITLSEPTDGTETYQIENSILTIAGT